MDLGIISAVLGPAASIIQKFKQEKSIIHEGLIIYHEDNEIDYSLHLNLGDQTSRIKRFKNFLKSRTLQKVTIDAIDATGFGMNAENLMELGLLSWDNNNKLLIDFPRILRTINSNLVILTFRTRFPSDLKNHLVYRQISRTTSLKNEKMVTNFEIILNHANMWYSDYISFSVRNILFTIGFKLDQTSLNEMLGDHIHKLEKADKAALTKSNARSFLIEFQKTLMEFQDSEFLDKLKDLLTIVPHFSGRLVNISSSTKMHVLPHSQIPLTIPGAFLFSISSNIEDRRTSIQGNMIFDSDGYNMLLKDKIQSFMMRNKKLKF